MMDTTYYWRKYGYMIFRIWHSKDKTKRKNILWYKVQYETNAKYREWIRFLQDKWFEIIGIISDGRQWLLWWFGDIPTQMCIVHQQHLITRYLTKKPRLEPNIELREIAMDLWKRTEKTITEWLDNWHTRNINRLYERNINKKCIHTRTIKAYKSLKRNMTYLYTFEKNPELWLPKTNNSLESINSHLKTKWSIHRWLREDRKDKFINYYLYTS